MEGQGNLTVTVHARELARAEFLAGSFVELTVPIRIGMAPETAARAFDPFFTTNPVGKGTGLGLSQVYGIARQGGGVARIASAPGQGTAVSIPVPLVMA